MKRRAVITGLGIVSPLGIGITNFWKAALAGQSGIRYASTFDLPNLPTRCHIVGEVSDFDPLQWMPATAAKMAGRFSHFAVAAAQMARNDSHFDTAQIPADQIRVAFGTSTNGLAHVIEPTVASFLRGEIIPPWAVLECSAHAATTHVAIGTGAEGMAVSFSTACAAGIDAITWAAEQVMHGAARVVIAGASETPLSACCISALDAVGVLSRWDGPPQEASRPFDRLRSGMVIAEGAAAVVVEDEIHARERSAHIYARILGSAGSTEATHLRKVDLTGRFAARAIALALHKARLHHTDIDYVSAHGNSMIDYDISETAGLKLALGSHAWNTPISSLKSMCGQALSASGAMQVVASCLAIRDQIAPPTINYSEPDPPCDLDYVPNVARPLRLNTALIHAHSMGGSHAALILGRAS
jgi:3-oxoacyl-[acyl-carrier-protein] synthase II